MQWTIVLTVSLLAGMMLLFVVMSAVLKRTGGYAPGWQVRCPVCGRTVEASKVGIVRIGAYSAGKRILGRCSDCNRLRWLALERTAEGATENVNDERRSGPNQG